LKDRDFHPSTFFKDMIGVTRNIESPIEHVTFIASAIEAPYLRTKPLHQSQKELGIQPDGSILFSIDVVLNHELERDLLAFGEGITVLSPDSLVEKLHKKLVENLENYEKRRKK
jgi:predicted DNA-binding transcriptional regulator YafY